MCCKKASSPVSESEAIYCKFHLMYEQGGIQVKKTPSFTFLLSLLLDVFKAIVTKTLYNHKFINNLLHISKKL